MQSTAAAICAEIGIKVIPTKARASTLGELETCASRTIEKLVDNHGAAHARLVLISLAETVNHRRELVAPTIEAVSDVLLAHPEWADRGWLDAIDTLDLAGMRSRVKRNMRAAPVRAAMATMIFDKLLPILGDERLI